MTTVRDSPSEADGRTMVGRLAVPAGAVVGATPAVLVAHEANGLDEHQRGRAEQLADLGYVAFALDCHGGGRPALDGKLSDIPIAKSHPAKARY